MKNYIVKSFIWKPTEFNYPATYLLISGHWKISFILSNHLKFNNENVIISSIPWIQPVNNAIHNITNAINTLNPTNLMSDFEPENNSFKIRLNFLLDQLKYLIFDKHARRNSSPLFKNTRNITSTLPSYSG